MKLNTEEIEILQRRLSKHPLLTEYQIKDIQDLRLFMEHHVFAVWDFMSLIKSMQHHVCPSSNLWVPLQRNHRKAARLINEIVLGEETDYSIDGLTTISHFDLYCQAMAEVGADTECINQWIEKVSEKGFKSAKREVKVPTASLEFMDQTFRFIDTGKPHIVSSVFCFGRETVIPSMFESLISRLDLNDLNCPRFFYYLERHIEIDGDAHGPASIELVEDICKGNSEYLKEAEDAAILALNTRIKLWDNVSNLIKDKHYLKNFFQRNS
jgi:hypothetical protein